MRSSLFAWSHFRTENRFPLFLKMLQDLRERDQLARARRLAQLAERLCLDLADALARHAEDLADLLEGMIAGAADPEAHAQDALLARRQPVERLGHELRKRARL